MTLVSLGIITSYFYDGERPSGYSSFGRFYFWAINGLKQMDGKEIFLAILAALIIGLITIFIIDRVFSNRPVVVGFEADGINKKIVLAIRKINSTKTEVMRYPTGSMAYRVKNLDDGLTRDKYESLVFTKNFNTLGVLYLNHEMWSSVDQEELNKEIENIKLLTTRPLSNG